MMDDREIVREKFSQLLQWEKIKRRENIVVAAFVYAVLASFLILPAKGLLPSGLSPLHLPAALFLFLAPALFLLRPWGRRESLRAIHRLDKTLSLDERAITAWDILGREEESAAQLLVIEETQKKLRAIDPRALFKRRLPWQARFALPLFLLWLLLVWFDFGVRWEGAGKRSGAASIAEKLKQFSRELQEKAEAQGLAESRKMAQALREIAEKRLREEIGERELKEKLTGLADKIEDRSRPAAEGADLILPAGSKEALLDLRAELESFKSGLAPGAAIKGGKAGREMRERLGSLPRLREEVERKLSASEEMDQKELQRFLEKLEQALAQELDRRTLSEVGEFLAFLLEGGEGPGRQEPLSGRGRGEDEADEEMRARGELPGDRPGQKENLPQAASPLRARALTQLKGLLGEGKGASLVVKGEPKARESEIAEEEILTSYRRKAEEEIASEKIPEGLKEIIKGYFLSLEGPEKK